MPAPSNAVFLSYASEDAPAVQRIAEALREAGIEVWFDREELRGGDVWDRRIREQIHDCRLFVPVVSAQTEAREEGYFRREWRLAVERAGDMAEDRAFLVPVVIDGISERTARVPDSFKHVQWTRLPGGEMSAGFVERVRRLLPVEGSSAHAAATAVPPSTSSPGALQPTWATWRFKPGPWAIAALVLVAVGYFAIDKFWVAKHIPATSSAAPATAAFSPPPHSIAVLPFVNMSGDKEQEYFSEGLTEELLNSLARINELQVAARTSSFSFQGEHPDIATVAHKLNVGAVLEGSVRRSANTVRITAQLVNGISGFHLWSQTYDRDLGDVLKLQTEIATAVASALRITLLGDESAKIEVGGTHNAGAFDAYLRASKILSDSQNGKDDETAISGYTEAIRLDPEYALAYAERSRALFDLAFNYATTESTIRASIDRARADAEKAITLAPNLGEGHVALAQVYEGLLEFVHASEEYDRALALASGNAKIVRAYGTFAALMGRTGPALVALHRAVTLDPVNPDAHYSLGWSLFFLRRHQESIAAFKDYRALDPSDNSSAKGFIGLNYYNLGDFHAARSFCENGSEDDISLMCFAITCDKLGRHADAEAVIAKIQASRSGGSRPMFFSNIYAQWGNTDRALQWLETAMRLRDPQLEVVKTSPALDPVRKEPRFQAIEQALKFPE